MPFKSEDQRRWAAEQVKDGKWTKKQFDEWNSETPSNIPKRKGPPRQKSLDELKKMGRRGGK